MSHEQDQSQHLPEFSDQSALRAAIAKLIETNPHPRKKNIGEGNAVLEVTDGRKFLIKWSAQIEPFSTTNVVTEAFKHHAVRDLLNNSIYGQNHNIKMAEIQGFEFVTANGPQNHPAEFVVVMYEFLELQHLQDVITPQNNQALIGELLRTLTHIHSIPLTEHVPENSLFPEYTPERYIQEARTMIAHIAAVVPSHYAQKLKKIERFFTENELDFIPTLIHSDPATHNIGVQVEDNSHFTIIPLDSEDFRKGCKHEDFARLFNQFLGKEELRPYLWDLQLFLQENNLVTDAKDRHAFLAMRVFKAVFLANHWRNVGLEPGAIKTDILEKMIAWIDRAEALVHYNQPFLDYENAVKKRKAAIIAKQATDVFFNAQRTYQTMERVRQLFVGDDKK